MCLGNHLHPGLVAQRGDHFPREPLRTTSRPKGVRGRLEVLGARLGRSNWDLSENQKKKKNMLTQVAANE